MVHLPLVIHGVRQLLVVLLLPLLHHVLRHELSLLLAEAVLLSSHIVRGRAALRVVPKVEICLVCLTSHTLELRLELLVHHVLLSDEGIHLVAAVLDRGIVVLKGDVYVQNHHRLVELDEGFWHEVCDFLLLSLQRCFVPSDFLDDLQVDLEFDQGHARGLDDLTSADKAFRLLVLQVVVQATHLSDLVLDVPA